MELTDSCRQVTLNPSVPRVLKDSEQGFLTGIPDRFGGGGFGFGGRRFFRFRRRGSFGGNGSR